MGAPVTPIRTAEYEGTTGRAVAMAGALVVMPHATVLLDDLPGLSTTIVEREDPRESRIGVVCYDVPAPGEPYGPGYIVQLTPDVARSIAASLFRLADQLEPRRPS